MTEQILLTEQEKHAATAKQLIMDYQGTFGTAEGKRVLEDLAKKCFEHQPTFTGEETHRTANREGMRYVILNIRSMIDMNPNEVKQETAKE